MDARPLRPRASENNIPVIHQRHKSTGSLAGMVSAAAAGFRGPAKRAAFGDVTNVARSSGGGGLADAKAIKSQSASNSVSSNHPAADTTLNKENAPYGNGKEQSTRPGQRPSLLANKPKQLSESQLAYPSVKPLQDAGYSQPLQPSSKPSANSASAVAPPLPQTSSELPPMQPRHYKSQPHLKAQQPSLRRTQSRFLETLDFAPTKLDDTSVEEVEPIDLQTLDIDQTSGHTAYLESVDFAADAESLAALNQHAEPLAAPIGHPATTDARPSTSHSYKTTQHPALSEPEEIWDEEEDEDYDDQDQAYTTAHSFRSRDFTTGGATTVLAPRLTARVQRELEAARIEVEQTRAAEDFEEEAWDVSMVAEYGDEIFDYLRELEIKMLPNPHYMEMQTEIQWSMRSVLMDWLVQVHSRFGLLPETLFLTVNYIDRFLSCKVISVTKLQLVGATALLVASKYEEINCPSMEEIVYMVDNGYSPDEILKAERFMLSMLNFELGWPGPMSFLRRVSKADDYDLDTRTLAKYFLELTIMDERFAATPPSFIAAGAHCLSRLILKKGDWSKPHVHFSGYTWGQLKPLVTMIIECCDHPRLHHSAVYEKYRERRFKEAATIVQHALDDGFTLPHHTVPVRAAKAQPACPRDTLEHLQYVGGLLPPIEG